MTTYNTGNPIGSTDPRDLYDNAENFDSAMHTPETTWTDRLGNARPSWAGATGYQVLAEYAAGINVTTYNQVIHDTTTGEYWRAAAGAALPYTTTGAGMPESGKFVSVGDAVLRGDLVAAGGSDLVGFQRDGTGAVVRTAQDKLREWVSVKDFGAVGDGVADDTVAIQSAINSSAIISGVQGETYLVASLNVPSNRIIRDIRLISAGGATDLVSVISVDGVAAPKSSIAFERVHIDGRRQLHTNIGSPEDGGRSGFRIRGIVSGITLRDCSANYCATDGLLLFGAAAGAAFPALSRVVVENCEFAWNRRHGISLDSAQDVTFSNVSALYNGRELDEVSPLNTGMRAARDVSSIIYGMGADVESYGATTHVENVRFINCTMLQNARSGLAFVVASNGVNDNPAWKPFSTLAIIGGRYDAGVYPSSEVHAIQCQGTGYLGAQTQLKDLTIDAVHCVDSIAFRNVSGARISAYVENVNETFAYHAFIEDSRDVEIDIQSPITPAIYESDSFVYPRLVRSGYSAPSLAVYLGPVQINSQTATKLSSSKGSGEVWRIEAVVELTGAVATETGFLSFVSVLSDRTVLAADASAYESATYARVLPVPFLSELPALLFKPGALGAHKIVCTAVIK